VCGWGGSGALAMPEKPSSSKGWTRLAGIGIEFAAAVGGFTLAGYWWDRHFGTAPWGLLVGALLGLVGGMYNLIRQSLLASRSSGSESQTPDDGRKP
jgi:F0F1-type ATP synthase assembly protein I